MGKEEKREFFPHDTKKILKKLKKDEWIDLLKQMVLIRNFEIRGEAAYQQGKVGGFYHSYMGQEAIQAAAVKAIGKDNWWITTYRCHALALLLGESPESLMAELYGKENGNAKGRGGSMHFYSERMLGGFGIVTSQVPVATGAAFSLKYQDVEDEIAICFLGDGAVPQGALHESLNLASLWDLPCLYVIENNQWGMGTAVENAVCVKRLAEDIAPSYNMNGYTFDGMDFFNCYHGFDHVFEEIKKKKRPVLVECVCERFRGHSISDPGLYRSKDDLKKAKDRDPIFLLLHELEDAGYIDEEGYKEIDKEAKEAIKEAMKYANDSPWPDPVTLEEGVFDGN